MYVYNGDTATDEAKIAGLTGSQIPDPIVSSGNQMLFRFASDFSVTERGFKATYLASMSLTILDPGLSCQQLNSNRIGIRSYYTHNKTTRTHV